MKNDLNPCMLHETCMYVRTYINIKCKSLVIISWNMHVTCTTFPVGLYRHSDNVGHVCFYRQPPCQAMRSHNRACGVTEGVRLLPISTSAHAMGLDSLWPFLSATEQSAHCLHLWLLWHTHQPPPSPLILHNTNNIPESVQRP